MLFVGIAESRRFFGFLPLFLDLFTIAWYSYVNYPLTEAFHLMVPFTRKFFGAALAAVALLCCLNGCGKRPNHAETPTYKPTEAAATEATTPPEELVEELAVVMTEGELYQLNRYPNLKKVDFSGSTCYAAIGRYAKNNPHIAVTYTVDLDGTAVSNADTAATLQPGTFDFDLLLENLQYLPALSSISLPDITLDAGQISALTEAYPGIALEYTVNLLGKSYALSTGELDLSNLSSSQVAEVVGPIGLLTNLTAVTLPDSLSMEDVALLQDANPSATFHYNFTLFGKHLSTTTETVEYKNHSIGDDGEAQIRQALAILDNCSRFVLDNCKIDFEILAAIREDFRDGPNVVWRVYFGKDYRYNALTDQEVIRAVYNVTDDTISGLKYCEGAKYIDMGHNEYLTDLSFIGHMPNLEVLIASGCAAKELVGFENCKKLTWLELAYCYKLENIDSLAGCESLRFLNLSFTKVKNYMPLDGLLLERFVCLSPKASTDEQNIFISIHPKPQCITVFYGYSNPYGYGWRYDDNGKTFNEYYKNVVRTAFNYDYLEQFLPKDEK